eukprot:TRINITY_DN3299_c0_g1_i1.p1 TRINITY_DN3299_c0_g1~~TRINITY_DN3299_c0_g1_i1.p1  ORF type:complete len:486 (+),score=84.82 TRINITY_DN3299_c0_g1_i1:1096-2553(+)
MGVAVDPSTRYGSIAGFVFVFNLVVGAGALSLPLGFEVSGLILGTIMLIILCFLSYVTVTFMIEALSIANALLHPNAVSYSHEVLTPFLDSSSEAGSQKKTFTVQGTIQDNSDEQDTESLYSIEKKVEVSEMAGLFLGFWGEKLFFLVITIYLYGDLAIYAVSIPKSLQAVTGTWTLGSLPCCNETEVFYFYMAGFILLVGPICFFEISSTKWLQYTTMLIRNASLFTMIILAIIYIASGEGMKMETVHWVDFKGFPQIFGVAIYAFMCHHSLPGIITPMENKKNVFKLMGLDMLAILSVYLLLVWTAVFAFGDKSNPHCTLSPGEPCQIQQLYTLNFASYNFYPLAVFLVLFPVFTLTTNFPLIAITLRSNLMHLVTFRREKMTPEFRSIIFTLITLVPPFIISTLTQNVALLVQITGAYAGLAIMFIFPTVFVHMGRIKAKAAFGENYDNPYMSPFSHPFWVYLVYAWTVFALGCQIYRQITA